MRAFCIQMQISKIMHESWGSIPFLLRTLSYLSIFDPFNWHLIFYLLFNWCLIDHVLFWFDSYWYHTSCVDVFWNQSYVDLIFPKSCVDLDFDIIWATFCVTLRCALFLVFLVFSSKLYLIWFLKDLACIFSNIYILYGMFVFLVPIYRGYSTKS